MGFNIIVLTYLFLLTAVFFNIVTVMNLSQNNVRKDSDDALTFEFSKVTDEILAINYRQTFTFELHNSN